MFSLRLTDEIELRLLEERHAEALFAVVDQNRDYLRKWLPWLEMNTSANDTRSFIKSTLDQFANNSGLVAGIWHSDRIVGVISYYNIDWLNRLAHIGYWLDARYQSKGIMTRACNALIEYGFKELELNRIEIRCAIGNRSSCAIPERLGFVYEGVARQAEWLYDHFVDLSIYGLLANDWKKRGDKSNSELRNIARQIYQRALAAIDLESTIATQTQLRGNQLDLAGEKVDLAEFKRILVIAIGKAALPMARAIDAVLGERISDGLVVTNSFSGRAPERMSVVVGGHPVPNRGSIVAAESALQMLTSVDDESTLVIFLISGGGSSLFEKPVDDQIGLDDLKTIYQVLVGCGAVISEINVVRRFLSAVKGGRLAGAAPRSRKISLYVSDVNTDDLASISSGPNLPGEITRADFDRIVKKYKLIDRFPPHISNLIASNSLPDLPRVNIGDTAGGERNSHHLLLDNRMVLFEAKRIAERDFGCIVEIASDLIEGDVQDMARLHLDRINYLRDKHQGMKVCLISGGEVICPVKGPGQGGRNQEFVLRAGILLEQTGDEDIVVLSAGTDGIDGNSPAAGAIVDPTSIFRAREQGLSPEDFLRESDSFTFFTKLGDIIITGPTGNNVRDLRILLAES
jgi:glycerate 2-kinase